MKPVLDGALAAQRVVKWKQQPAGIRRCYASHQQPHAPEEGRQRGAARQATRIWSLRLVAATAEAVTSHFINVPAAKH